MTIWMLLILILLFFFAKSNGSINHLIGYESVKKNHIDIYVYMKNECWHSYQRLCLIDSATTYTILKSNKFFSCLIVRDINVSIIYSTTNIFEGSRRAIIFLPRS